MTAETPTIQQIIAGFQAEAAQLEAVAAKRLIESYQRIYGPLKREQDALVAKIAAQRAAGKEVSKAMLWRDAQLKGIIRSVEEQFQKYAAVIEDNIMGGMPVLAQLGIEQSERLTQIMLAGFPPQVTAEIMATFGRMPAEAVEAMVAALLDESPLVTQTLASFGKEAAEGIGNALVKNLVMGRHPSVTAREMTKAWGAPLTRALTISRTEQLRAHRAATLASYRNNPHIVRGWIWHAELDGTTCMSCVAQHGTVHGLNETLDDHPNGRCAMVPLTPTWEELGFSGLPETRIEVPSGESWFGSLSEQEQAQMMGKDKFEAWKAGRFQFSALSAERHDRHWGRTFAPASLKELI